MRGISMYDSSSVSTLFSSLSTSKSGDLLGINYSDYASIRSGSYGKLMRSYFSMDSTKSTSKSDTVKTDTSTSKDSTKTLASIESDAQDLTDSAKALYQRSNNKAFTKDAQGNYNTDKIYNAVSDFVDDYNSLIKSGEKASTRRITQSISSMKSTTASNESALKELGITIDEKTFKSADMSKAKSLFNGTGSYAYSVATQAAMTESYAKTEASRANTYGKSGTYNYNYNSGNIFADAF